MQVQNFEFTQPVVLKVQGGDAVIHGDTDRTTIQIVAPNAPSLLEPTGDGMHLQVKGPVTVRLPADASFTIAGFMDDVVLRRLGEVVLAGSCSGDLVASELTSLQVTHSVSGDIALRNLLGAKLVTVDGDLAISQLGSLLVANCRGDVSLSDVKTITIEKIEGDLSCTQAETIQIQELSGDVSLNSFADATSLGRINGDLSVASPGSQLAATEVRGDAQLSGLLQDKGSYWINASGDISASVDGNIKVAIRASGDIKLGSDWDILTDDADIVTATIGEVDNAAELNLQAQGDVFVNSPGHWQQRHRNIVDGELKRAKTEINDEVKRAEKVGKVEAAAATRQMNQDFSGETVPGGTGASVRDIVRDLLDALDTPAPSNPRPAQAPTTAKQMDSSELQVILEMLEQGTISIEEAENLIAALQG